MPARLIPGKTISSLSTALFFISSTTTRVASTFASTASRSNIRQQPPRPTPSAAHPPTTHLHKMSTSSSMSSTAAGSGTPAAAAAASPAPGASTSPGPSNTPSRGVEPPAGGAAPASSASESQTDGSQQPESPAKPLPALPGLPSPDSSSSTSNPNDGTKTVHVNGQAVALDNLGPMVVGRDGTISRIGNWHEMTEFERQNTLRILGKRNQLRLANLRAGRGADEKPERE